MSNDLHGSRNTQFETTALKQTLNLNHKANPKQDKL